LQTGLVPPQSLFDAHCTQVPARHTGVAPAHDWQVPPVVPHALATLPCSQTPFW